MTTFAGLYGASVVVNSAGIPQPGQLVTVYNVGTTTLATLYTDNTATTTVPNPTTTDSLGNLTFYALPGRYTLSSAAGRTTVAVVPDPQDYAFGQTIVGQVLAQLNFFTGGTYTQAINGSSLAAIDPTNLTTPPFIVPTSGQFRVQASACVFITAAASTSLALVLGVVLHGSTQLGPQERVLNGAINTSYEFRPMYDAIITGQTPGTTIQLDLAGFFFITAGGGAPTAEVVADNGVGGAVEGPVLMTVLSA